MRLAVKVIMNVMLFNKCRDRYNFKGDDVDVSDILNGELFHALVLLLFSYRYSFIEFFAMQIYNKETNVRKIK